jgi:hypothetical protein
VELIACPTPAARQLQRCLLVFDHTTSVTCKNCLLKTLGTTKTYILVIIEKDARYLWVSGYGSNISSDHYYKRQTIERDEAVKTGLRVDIRLHG